VKTLLIFDFKIREVRAKNPDEEKTVIKAVNTIMEDEAEILILETKVPDELKETLRQRLMEITTEYLADSLSLVKRPYRIRKD
jgi:NCAIR mutase (PurE)-related protein